MDLKTQALVVFVSFFLFSVCLSLYCILLFLALKNGSKLCVSQSYKSLISLLLLGAGILQFRNL